MRWMDRNDERRGGREGKGGQKGAGRGWVRRSDRREDSITRHQQPRAYLVAIGFSLPKASPALYQIVHSATLVKLIGISRTREHWNRAGWRIIDHPVCIYVPRVLPVTFGRCEIKERELFKSAVHVESSIRGNGLCVKSNAR